MRWRWEERRVRNVGWYVESVEIRGIERIEGRFEMV